MHLQRIGVWAHELRHGEESVRREAAALLEELGYGTLWFPGSGGDDSLDCARVLLDATQRVTVATGITNIWTEDPVAVAAAHADLARTYDHRFVLGLGISHRRFVNQLGGNYDKPLSAMNVYLDGLDAAPEPPPIGERVIAALGPKMLTVSRERASGTHPYLVTAEHTRRAREAVGPDKLVAPEQAVVLESDPDARPGAGPRAPRALPRASELREQLEAPGLHRRGRRRRGQRPPRRRARRVGRRGRDLRTRAGARRRRRRPRLPAGHPRRGRPAACRSGAGSRAR